MINPLNTTIPAPLTGRPSGNPLPTGATAPQPAGSPTVPGQITGGQFTAAITAGLVDLRPAGEALQKLASLVQINISELLALSASGEADLGAAPSLPLLSADLKNQILAGQPFHGALFEALSLILEQNKNNSSVKNDVADILRVFSAAQQLPRTAETVSSNLTRLVPFLSVTSDSDAAAQLQRMIALCRDLSGITAAQSVSPAGDGAAAFSGPLQPAKELLLLSHETLQSLKTLADRIPPSAPEHRLIRQAEKSLRRLEILAAGPDLSQTVSRLVKTLGESPDAVSLLQNALANTPMTKPAKTTLEQVLSLIAATGEQNRSNENILALCDQSLRSIAASLDSRIPLLYGLLPPLTDQADALGELWIDPDDPGQGLFSRPGLRLLLSLDVPEIGHLEVELTLQDKQISSRFLCPPDHLANFSGFGEILGAAASDVGFTMGRLQILPLSQARRLEKIFAKNVMGRSGLNARA